MINVSGLENIESLVLNGGELTLGEIGPVPCAATACDEAQCLAMLVLGKDETIAQLLQRLDSAIEDAWEHQIFADEINP